MINEYSEYQIYSDVCSEDKPLEVHKVLQKLYKYTKKKKKVIKVAYKKYKY